MNKAFNPDMLILGRMARGLSQSALADCVPRLSQSRLSRVEAGLTIPIEEEVGALAQALRFRPELFFRAHSRRAMPATYHRKRQRLTKGGWDAIYARAELVRIAIADMLNSVELTLNRRPPPSIELEDFHDDPDAIAEAIRQFWEIPRGPIADVTRIVEGAGVIVVHLDFGSDLIDGFSQHAMDRIPPIIFVNQKLTTDRLRFTLCHELAHLLLHLMPNPKMEDQANSFASAFLMPRDDIRHELYSISLERLKALKLSWKTSMSALVRRARDLGKISEASYKYYNIEMSRRGWRTKEPVDIIQEIERPRIVRQLVDAHIGKLEYSISELAKLVGWEDRELDETFGVSQRPRLRLVVN